MAINDLVIQTLTIAGKPMKAGEIALAAGVEKTEVEKAIKQLKKEEKLYSPKNCFYDVIK
jgi:DNA-binding transcriptional regulator GbsR (MarR family)